MTLLSPDPPPWMELLGFLKEHSQSNGHKKITVTCHIMYHNL